MPSPLKNILTQISPLPQDILQEVVQQFQHMEYPKNYVLHKQGRVCRHLWFMTKGAIRFFYITDEGRELNTWFSLDQQIVTDAPGLVSQTVSRETIQLIEDSELYAIEYSALQWLLKKHHAVALWYIKIWELHYVAQVEDRIADLQFLDAKQRYQKLLDHYPGITNRISLGHIASYLNITQETLSRLRSPKA